MELVRGTTGYRSWNRCTHGRGLRGTTNLAGEVTLYAKSAGKYCKYKGEIEIIGGVTSGREVKGTIDPCK